MKLNELAKSVLEHRGEFSCEEIHNESRAKLVQFQHDVTPPEPGSDLPTIGRLGEFYETFGSIAFYVDPKSGDAARFVAAPSQWAELTASFGGWFDGMDEEERQECGVPGWVESCLVVGETPASGNYILMATDGGLAGRVFEFDHDGFEFTQQANDIVEYAEKMLNPGPVRLTDFASHMRFVDDKSESQWWIRELRDNRGRQVSTQA